MYKSTYIYVGIEAWYLVIHSSQCDLEPESFVVVQILVTLAHTHAHTHPHTSPHAIVTHTPTHTHTHARAQLSILDTGQIMSFTLLITIL